MAAFTPTCLSWAQLVSATTSIFLLEALWSIAPSHWTRSSRPRPALGPARPSRGTLGTAAGARNLPGTRTCLMVVVGTEYLDTNAAPRPRLTCLLEAARRRTLSPRLALLRSMTDGGCNAGVGPSKRAMAILGARLSRRSLRGPKPTSSSPRKPSCSRLLPRILARDKLADLVGTLFCPVRTRQPFTTARVEGRSSPGLASASRLASMSSYPISSQASN